MAQQVETKHRRYLKPVYDESRNIGTIISLYRRCSELPPPLLLALFTQSPVPLADNTGEHGEG